MDNDIQAIIIKKSHPDVNSYEDARRVARSVSQDLGLDKPIRSRATGSSYRFRFRDPQEFEQLRTAQVPGGHTSIVHGTGLPRGMMRGWGK